MWRTVPIARIFIPFVAGIVGAYLLPVPCLADRWLVPALCVLLCFFFLGLRRDQSRHHRLYFGLGLWLWLLGAGAVSWLQSASEGRVRYPLEAQQEGYFLGRVLEVDQREGKGDRLWVRLLANGPAVDSLYRNRQQLLVYIQGVAVHHPGDVLVFSGQVRPVPANKNPGAFDYRFYLFTQGVRFQVFARQVWSVSGERDGTHLAGRLFRLRQQISARLTAGLTSPSVEAVSKALILGQKDDLSQATREAYARAGAMHVLAVSGLHVGIVAMFVQYILGRLLPFGVYRKQLKVMGGMAAVWLFALITGGAASVIRAALMFSLMMLGQLYRTRAGIWNSLLAAALLMLWANPLFIFQLSFQLSFTAVAGIVYFHPLLYRLWYCPYRLGDYIWSLTCVGLAAQLTTAPLTIYHFGQFPVLFWLSGWVVIPLATVVLMTGILKIVLGGVPILASLLTYMLDGGVTLMNAGMQVIARPTAAVVEALSLSREVLLLTYFALLVAMLSRRFFPGWRSWSGWPVLLIVCLLSHYQWRLRQQRLFVLYQVEHTFMLDIVRGPYAWALFGIGLEEKQREFASSGFRQKRSIRYPQNILCQQGHLITVRTEGLYLVWQRAAGEWPDSFPVPPEVVVVEQGAPPGASPPLSESARIYLGPRLSPKHRQQWKSLFAGSCTDLPAGEGFVVQPKINKP